MTTMGIRPGDAVLVIEHRGEQQLVYNALVLRISADDKMAGIHGEPAIEACFVASYAEQRTARDVGALRALNIVHISHRDFVEGRAGLGYEELPGALPGVCRYCGCTEQRACAMGCGWIDAERTVCSNPVCWSKHVDYITQAATRDGGS